MASFFKPSDRPLTPAKRLTTPAGQRLSVILENGTTNADAPPIPTRSARRMSMMKGGSTVGFLHKGGLEKSSGSSHSIWSEESGGRFAQLRNNKHLASRGGWKRAALVVVAIILTLVVAVTVGVVYGVQKKNNKSASNPTNAQVPTTISGTTPSGAAAIPVASGSTTPSSFPVGSYSMITFLDTIATNCTSNPSTWRCYPYTIYNDDPVKAMATFNWVITAGSTKGTYQLSSSNNPFSITFSNAPLSLLDGGKDTEHYRFQISTDKQVSPSQPITDDNASATCFYNGTTFQAYLYTKMAKTYPTSSQGADTSAAYPPWPYAVRVEQVIGGGSNVPNCYKTNNGVIGERITQGLDVEDSGSLCSCLYRNWRTPSP